MNGMECWIDPRFEAVRVTQVQSYLFARGWEALPYPRSELLVFRGASDDAGQPILQILPAAETMADYRPRLVELITALAAIENRTAAAILDDMLANPSVDRPSPTNGASSVQTPVPGISAGIPRHVPDQ
jgi:hypothetical protein